MLARVRSCAVQGIDGIPLAVEVDNRFGQTKYHIVGLPDTAIKESEQRVNSAIKNSGFRIPYGVTVVNLAPANIRKEGSALDLPIAIGILMASEQLASNRLNEVALAGELALDGSVRPVSGALCMAIGAKRQGLETIVLPRENAAAAAVVPGIKVVAAATLHEAVDFLTGAIELDPYQTNLAALVNEGRAHVPDLTDVKGQAHVKRALTVAAAGGHNMLMIGPPGTGKTMLASRLPGILPDLTFDEALETTRVYSVSDDVKASRALITSRPFRSPHHTTTTVAMVGGGQGSYAHPGEVSLAHNGVLFMDELPEFQRSALEVLRQPLEEGVVHIRRAMYSVTYPSNFMLVVAMNPCPCGCLTDPHRHCHCSIGAIQRYRNRISGPLLDRIDIHVDVPALTYDEIADRQISGPTSAQVREQVQAARDIQRERYNGAYSSNARLDSKSIRSYCALEPAAESLLPSAMHRLGFSARAYDKVLKLARTIADLEASEKIQQHHVGEAIQYRSLDREQAQQG